MSITNLPANFAGQSLDIIIIGNERWLKGSQIVTPLGFQSGAALKNILKRSRDEFDTATTMIVELPTARGPRLTRLFNQRGVMLLCMKAQTAQAATFRRWALDVLEGKAPPASVQPAPHLVPSATARGQLAELACRAEPRLRRLARYRKLGLSRVECGKLLNWSPNTVTKQLRVLEALDLLEPPANLAAMRARAAIRLVPKSKHTATVAHHG